MSNEVDISENELLEAHPTVFQKLLFDHTTRKNVFLATDSYVDLGEGYLPHDEITIPKITGEHGLVLRPRAIKSREEQTKRSRDMAEVFTSSWTCNAQNNLVDDAWFGRKNVFNTETTDADGNPAPVYSNASGLDYPAAGPEHALLHAMDRVKYTTVDDEDAIEALFLLSRHEGIIPAIESSHALAYAIRVARTGVTGSILVNLSGRGDKDLDFVVQQYGYGNEFLEKLAAKRAGK